MERTFSPVTIRTYRKEDIEYVVKRHRELYDAEFSFGTGFGDYVEKYMLQFDECHDEDKENIWIAEVDKKIAGVVAIVKAYDLTAQLRWFLVEPEMRGRGLGHKLMKIALDFCRDRGYEHVFLWTVSILGTARHLYGNYGFVLTETKGNNTWADGLTEERWDLCLK